MTAVKNSRFVKFGPPIPLRRPKAIPSSYEDEEPLWVLRANEQFVPFINGAMAIYLKDELWLENDPELLRIIEQRFDNLMSSWERLQLAPTDFMLSLTASAGYGYDINGLLFGALSPGLSGIGSLVSGFTGDGQLTIKGHPNDSIYENTGGQWLELDIVGFDEGGAINMTITPCLGDPFTDNYTLPFRATELFSPEEMVWKRIDVNYSVFYPIFATAWSQGDMLCGPV